MGGEDTTTTTTTTTTTNEGGGARPPRVKGVRVVRAVCDGVNTVLRACEEQLNEVNERYSFELNPEYRIKMKKRCVRVVCAQSHALLRARASRLVVTDG